MQNKDPLKFYSTAQVAGLAGVHKDTLLRWLRVGLVNEPDRDRRGWRTFSQSAAAEVVLVAKSPKTVRGKNLRCSADLAIAAKLSALDWDFHGAKTQYLTHSLHPYPAKYIPQIPNTLIQELSSVGDTVLDIFSGSGTTLVEALTLKRHAVGVDASPLAVLIGKAKTTILDSGDVNKLNGLVNKANNLSDQISLRSPNLFAENPFVSDAYRPDVKAIYFWFESFVVEELAEILSWCKSLSTKSSETVATVAFSSVIVAVSKQDSDTRYVRREKNLRPGDTLKKFARALSSATHKVEEFTDFVEDRFDRKLICSSLLDNPDLDMVDLVDLVVCSPPYPNAFSYHLYHMTRMVWLGMDQPKFKKQEIGSHRKYSSKGANAATVGTFYNEMECIFGWLSKLLKKDGYACFVVGDSTIKGEKIDNTSLLSEAASHQGFIEVTRIERIIQKTKKSFNPKIGKIRQEHILVLRKL